RGERGAEEQCRECEHSKRLERHRNEQVARRAGGRDEPVDDPEGTGAGELERAQPATSSTSPSLLSAWILDRADGLSTMPSTATSPSSVPASTLYSPGGTRAWMSPEPVRRVMREVGH